jgi:serine/threonine protein kinase
MPHIGCYELSDIIGRGRFGRVYKGVHTETGHFVAVKLENKQQDSKLLEEAEILKTIGETCNGVPEIIQTGSSKKWNFMIMSFLGPNIEELFIYQKRNFSLKTTLMLADQILNIIKGVHESGIVHRDIKPDNFVMGFGDTHNKLYLIDFGLSMSYINMDTLQHNSYEHKRQFTGSFRYSSINNHKGIQQSRRDDLESIGYMLIYFYKGRLPWQNIPANNKKEKLHKTYLKKKSISIEELCCDCPKEFRLYMEYCRKLGYKERPDYSYIKHLFYKVMKRNKFIHDGKYDWNTDIDTEQKKELMKTELQNIKTVKIHRAYKQLKR